MQPVLVLTWRWVHELLWVVAEQSILDVATAHTAGPWGERERWTLELDSEQPGGRCWGASTALGLTERAELGPGPAQDVLSGLVCGVSQPWKRLFVSWGCSSPAPAGDRTAACRATSLAGLGGLPMSVESPKCLVPTVWECSLWCNCRAAFNRDFPLKYSGAANA